MTAKKLGFKVHGDFVTRHARGLWAEREFSKALKLTGTLVGMSLEDQYNLLSGVKRLEGVNELTLVDEEERVTHQHGVYLLSLTESYQYKDLCILREKLRVRVLISEYEVHISSPEGHIPKVRLMYDAVTELLEAWHDPTNKEFNELKAICLKALKGGDFEYDALFRLRGWGKIGRDIEGRYIDQEFEAAAAAARKRERASRPKAALVADLARTAMATAGLDQEDALSAAKVLMGEEVTVPTPVGYGDALGARHGWLSPRGDLYTCGYMAHQSLADELKPDEELPSVALEREGWVKLTRSRWMVDFARKVSERQKGFILDWCSTNQKEVPVEVTE